MFVFFVFVTSSNSAGRKGGFVPATPCGYLRTKEMFYYIVKSPLVKRPICFWTWYSAINANHFFWEWKKTDSFELLQHSFVCEQKWTLDEILSCTYYNINGFFFKKTFFFWRYFKMEEAIKNRWQTKYLPTFWNSFVKYSIINGNFLRFDWFNVFQ